MKLFKRKILTNVNGIVLKHVKIVLRQIRCQGYIDKYSRYCLLSLGIPKYIILNETHSPIEIRKTVFSYLRLLRNPARGI